MVSSNSLKSPYFQFLSIFLTNNPSKSTKMSFSESSEDIRIEVSGGSTTLYASAEDNDGNLNETSIDLDEVIGNDDGKLYYP